MRSDEKVGQIGANMVGNWETITGICAIAALVPAVIALKHSAKAAEYLRLLVSRRKRLSSLTNQKLVHLTREQAGDLAALHMKGVASGLRLRVALFFLPLEAATQPNTTKRLGRLLEDITTLLQKGRLHLSSFGGLRPEESLADWFEKTYSPNRLKDNFKQVADLIADMSITLAEKTDGIVSYIDGIQTSLLKQLDRDFSKAPPMIGNAREAVLLTERQVKHLAELYMDGIASQVSGTLALTYVEPRPSPAEELLKRDLEKELPMRRMLLRDFVGPGKIGHLDEWLGTHSTNQQKEADYEKLTRIAADPKSCPRRKADEIESIIHEVKARFLNELMADAHAPSRPAIGQRSKKLS